MRLLNTSTLEVREFAQDPSQDVNGLFPYAILSHRWEAEEVTYQDLVAGRGPGMKGYAKVRDFCRQALSDGWEWVWMDTCCIDKSSSAELSEAINSIYNWYRDSRVCYVYLSDVPPEVDLSIHLQEGSAFRNSQWFLRGWTLQELLAPEYVAFYDSEWREIGTKSCLESVITSITGIKELRNPRDACIARKMSWASNRQTSRPEDLAYSLMGIFGVNMPLLYGEGTRAFLRLQLEIIKFSDDESIFAWFDTRDKSVGMFAAHVSSFQSSGDIVRMHRSEIKRQKQPYTMTNTGLHMRVHLIPSNLLQRRTLIEGKISDDYILPLACMREASIKQVVVLGLKCRRAGVFNVSHWAQAAPRDEIDHLLDVQKDICALVDIYVVQHGSTDSTRCVKESRFVVIKCDDAVWRHWRASRFSVSNLCHLTEPKGSGTVIEISQPRVSGSLVAHLWEELQVILPDHGAIQDAFVVVLAVRDQKIGVRVFLPEQGEDSQTLWQKLRTVEGIRYRYDSYDRVSVMLPSGKHVSVSLKPAVEPKGGSNRLGHWYVMEVKVEEQGSPRWPVPTKVILGRDTKLE